MNSLLSLYLVGLLGLSLLGMLGLGGCAAAEAQGADGVVHLTLWQGVNPPANRDVLQKLVDRFNQTHADIQVESLYVGQGDQQIPKILAAVVGNVPPNLLWYAPMITGQLVELEAIAPLDDWLDSLKIAEIPVAEAIDPVLFESMRLENHLWSVPFSVNNVGIFYRPSLFAADGIAVPQTWAELRQAAQQLTHPAGANGQGGQHGILLPLGKGEWTVFMWLPFLWSAGGDLTSSELPSSKLSSPAATMALQFWQDLVNDGSAVLSQPERGYEIDQFVAGKVAMQLTGPWTLGQLQATGVDYAVMPIPVQTQPATSIGGENLFILKTTPQEEQAAKVFAEYVLSETFQTTWAIETGYLPVNLKSRQSTAYQAFLQQQPAVQVFLDQAQYGHSRPISPGYNRLSDAVGRAIESVLLGADPQQSLIQAQQRLDRTRAN